MAQKCKLPELFFDNRAGNYWLKLPCGRFLSLDARNVKLHLMQNEFYIDEENDFGLKSGDGVLVKTQLEKWVDYAGPLAGKKIGMFVDTAGKRILVTSQAAPVQPDKRKGCAKVERYFDELLGPEQTQYALLWLKVAWEALRAGVFRPGQLLCLAGEAGCGKSFFHVLVTMLLGGRQAKPYRYMSGKTNFNADLAGAEHLVIEDENAKLNIGARREFGTAIKNWTVDEHISVHAKGREALTLGFFRRLSLSVNWETEYLMILPPMDQSILDKVMLFKCGKASLSEDRDANMQMLKDELPGLVYLLTQMRIPKAMKDARFGVAAYHHPEILEVLSELSPEYRLEQLIDQVIFAKEADNWRGSSEELEQVLRNSSFGFAVDRLLPFTSACGTFLARLVQKKPARYQHVKSKGRSVWTIKGEL